MNYFCIFIVAHERLLLSLLLLLLSFTAIPKWYFVFHVAVLIVYIWNISSIGIGLGHCNAVIWMCIRFSFFFFTIIYKSWWQQSNLIADLIQSSFDYDGKNFTRKSNGPRNERKRTKCLTTNSIQKNSSCQHNFKIDWFV